MEAKSLKLWFSARDEGNREETATGGGEAREGHLTQCQLLKNKKS